MKYNDEKQDAKFIPIWSQTLSRCRCPGGIQAARPRQHDPGASPGGPAQGMAALPMAGWLELSDL